MLSSEFVIELCDEYIEIYGGMYAKSTSEEYRKFYSYIINTLTEIRDDRYAREIENQNPKDDYQIAREIFV